MSFKFIDLFAGIGGFHLGLSKVGMTCVFASELDKHARDTYLNNHTGNFIFNDDIRKVSPSDIPDHDVLCAGFPCQPFSQAGKKKGFEDGDSSERGNLFFCIADILEEKKPSAFILENVRHLLNHDNGNTFSVIKSTLEELNYSVHYKIIKASDFGQPQHRPRIYIVGFNNDKIKNAEEFQFPTPIPLTKTMSDIWGGNCEKKIGFTLRVGGRGSPIDDRRNWDSYRVNGEVVQLGPIQGKKMMGFPDDFIMPKSIVQSMKQLGNSVCVDVVEHLAESVKSFLVENNLDEKDALTVMKKNKGEWSEVYAFFKMLIDNHLVFIDENSLPTDDYVTVIDIAHNNSDVFYSILNSDIVFKDLDGNELKREQIHNIITKDEVEYFLSEIIEGKETTFEIPFIESKLNEMNISQSKGKSFEKGDLKISFDFKGVRHPLSSIGIKSYLGNPPTLLNASKATNFIFEVSNLNCSIDQVNSINTRSKIKDRLSFISSQGATLKFIDCELNTHTQNLRLIDSNMPFILSKLLIKFYKGEGNKIKDLIDDHQEVCRVKDYLKSVMLGMFYTKPWDGSLSSDGSIIVKKDGKLQLIHLAKYDTLKNYIFNHVKMDTPSSSRHRFGSLYSENGKTYIKLNLQIRMI